MIFLAFLFFILSPGMLLTLPPGSKGVWMSCQTSVAAAFVHTIIFSLLVYYMVDILRALGFKEGFEGGIGGWLTSLFSGRPASSQRMQPVAQPSTRLTLPVDGSAHVRRAYDESATSR
jgi:hypothetical protein